MCCHIASARRHGTGARNDDGAVEAAAGPSAPIHEIELELKNGDPEQLYHLALAILHDVPLRIDHLSKADRGYGLLMPEQSAAVKAEPLKLKKRNSVEEAFQVIARNCLAQIYGNERGVVFGQDPSSVHQMRVGLRRLRSALDLFAPVIPAPADFDNELRWIAGELGKARDWEVLAGTTLEKAFDSAAEDVDATAVQQAAANIATENRKAAVAAVNSVRYTRLSIQFKLWIDEKGWQTNQPQKSRKAQQKSITGFAGETLKRRHKNYSSAATASPNSMMKRAIALASRQRKCDMRPSSSRRCLTVARSSITSAC